MKKLLVACFTLLSACALAQQSKCGTQMTEVQLQQLRKFQQAGNFSRHLGKTLQYIPVKVHISGKDNGQGHYPVGQLMQAFCKINHDFAPVGFYFYIKDSIDYIDDTDLYNFDYSNSSSAIDFSRDFDAVNVYFVGTATGICGVYLGGSDVVVILNSCQTAEASTLTHELGHFFSLPHTFSGWEGGTPPAVYQELASGSNCRNAGDGFCDTRADYLAGRWNCPYSGVPLKDPEGAGIHPDETLFMSYAMDACEHRFSDEQMAAMDDNLNNNRFIATAPVSMDSLRAPVTVSPANNDSNQNNNVLRFTWKPVPGAFAYNVQIFNWNGFNSPFIDVLLKDTTYTATQLPGRRDLYWRVKAISQGFTCTAYSPTQMFYTANLPRTGFGELLDGKKAAYLYPNPVGIHEKWNLQMESGIAEVVISNIEGKELFSATTTSGTVDYTYPSAGCYLVRIKAQGTTTHIKQVVTQ